MHCISVAILFLFVILRRACQCKTSMKKLFVPFLLSFAALAASVAVSAAPMTNADVIKMINAGLDESIIITSIQNAENGFDASANGLIALSEAKVPKPIVNAIIQRTSAKTTPAAQAPAAEDDDSMRASDIYMIDGSETKVMRYITAQSRTAQRGLGFGGVATYTVLRGSNAVMRTKNTTPSFLIAIPDQAQPESYFTLANFEIRKNGSREVMVGASGFASYSTGIHKSRIVEMRAEKVADQTKAPKKFTIYKLTPAKPMAAGEYAMVLYTGELQSLVGEWFGNTGNSYFDFGIDK